MDDLLSVEQCLALFCADHRLEVLVEDRDDDHLPDAAVESQERAEEELARAALEEVGSLMYRWD